jgi:predicted DNA-binding mobile mystery protein A
MCLSIDLQKTNMPAKTRDRQRAALSRRFAAMRHLKAGAQVPELGWIHAVRSSLGMSAEALGHRMNVSKRAIQSLEAGEVSGTAQLSTLRAAADALDCDLIYMLLPRTSLDDMLHRHAFDRATRELGGFHPDNGIDPTATRPQDLGQLIKALKSNPRTIWREGL